MPRRALLLAGVMLALAVILLAAPARLLPRLIEGQPLLLSGLSGTVWRGTAARAVLDTGAGTLHLGALRWHLEPLSLLTLAPRIAIESQWGQQRLAARVRRTADAGLSLRDLAANFDARMAQRWLPVELRGRIEADLARLEISNAAPVAAQGRLLWRDAGWVGPAGQKALGTYVAELETPEGGAIAATIDTLAGPVRAVGTASLGGGRYAVQASVGPEEVLDAELRQALSLVAVPGENGYLLRLNGALAAPP
jgi:hypothetical protein